MTPTALAAPTATATADDLAALRERGWLLKRGVFDAALIARLSDEIDGLHERMARAAPDDVHVAWEEGLPADRPPRIRQLMNSERVSPIIDAMSRSPALLDVLRAVMGPDLGLFHSKLMMKAAHDGTFTPWHQDWGYWRHHTRRPTQMNAMLAIDAADRANGALRFVDGSHLGGPLDHRDFRSASFSIGLDGGIEDRASTLVDMAPGDVVFFGPLVVHGSGPNRSPRDRRANTFAFDVPANQNEGELPPSNHRCGRWPNA